MTQADIVWDTADPVEFEGRERSPADHLTAVAATNVALPRARHQAGAKAPSRAVPGRFDVDEGSVNVGPSFWSRRWLFLQSAGINGRREFGRGRSHVGEQLAALR